MRSQFANYRVLPRLEVIELFFPEHSNLVRLCERAALLERGTLGSITFGMCIRYHQDKVIVLKTDQPHGACHRTRRCNAQILFPLADILQVDIRREARLLGKCMPRECGAALAFIVVVLDELAIICIFNYFLHGIKYRSIFAIWNIKFMFLSKFYHFFCFFKKFRILEHEFHVPRTWRKIGLIQEYRKGPLQRASILFPAKWTLLFQHQHLVIDLAVYL